MGAAVDALNLRRLDLDSPDQLDRLQRVIDRAPDYSIRISGHPPERFDPNGTALPEGKTADDRYLYGVYLGDEMIGCVDLLRGYPDEKTAMLGLLLLSEQHQRRGFGARTYREVERIISGWPEISLIRAAIIASNDIVIPFWKKMGLVDTGIRKPYREGAIASEYMIFEKALETSKPRR